MTNRNKISIIILAIGIFAATLVCGPKNLALAIANPSAVYCEKLGYEFGVKELEGVNEETSGDEIGICTLPDGSEVDSWEFLKGKAGQKYNYCATKGYETKSVTDENLCSNIFSEDCTFCVLKDGTEKEVIDLMIEEKAISRDDIYKSDVFLEGEQPAGQDSENAPAPEEQGKSRNDLVLLFVTLLITVIVVVGIVILYRLKKRKI